MLKPPLLLIASFLIIVFGIRIFFFFESKPPKYQDGQFLNFETTLFSEPKISGKTQKLNVDYQSNRIFVTTSLFPEFHYGDKITIVGTLKVKLLNNKSTIYSMNFPKIEAKTEHKNFILAITGSIRQKIIAFFNNNLSPNLSGLLLGIVFGIKEGIPQDFFNNLRQVGVLHIIAASGMNVTLVTGFISSVFLLFLRRQIALILSILGILFYAVLAGGEASIIRASIMGILVFSAQILGRQAWPAFVLFLTGYLMLFWDPGLIFDIGFQLSFLATIGLLYLKPVFKHPLLDTFQTTIFAQVATLPVVIANFGIYSLWSVLVNGLILWTVPSLMVVGGVSAILSFLVQPLARLLLLLGLPILIYFEAVVKFFSGLGAVVKISELNWFVIVGYYLLVISLILFLRKKEN